MTPDPFTERMRELDALVEECRGRAPFSDGIVRDTSNRSNRDWPWWSVEVEQSDDDGFEKRRATATVRLNSNQNGEPGSFEGQWLARVWQGVSVDSFREQGGWPLVWERPTAKTLEEAMTALLAAARAAIGRNIDSGNQRQT